MLEAASRGRLTFVRMLLAADASPDVERRCPGSTRQCERIPKAGQGGINNWTGASAPPCSILRTCLVTIAVCVTSSGTMKRLCTGLENSTAAASHRCNDESFRPEGCSAFACAAYLSRSARVARPAVL